ncbi:hypothetical protein TRICI_003364 [Trichomonascus ciferrii]|uniref:Calcineurin-like phosphoesterase domain-containing protein n=1 Tax=Trichomonascus ciferrii TaxID=44093 RepID=A0A642V448_9ASCO|nr:hypothetical protein TRICI_003364 [Trichomonascus ciferrii]
MNLKCVLLWLFVPVSYGSSAINETNATAQKLELDSVVGQLLGLVDLYKAEDEGESDRCKLCKQGLAIGRKVALEDKGKVSTVLEILCRYNPFGNSEGCEYYHGEEDLPHSTFSTDINNVLTLIDPYGDDGEYLCHYMLGGLCKQPTIKDFDISGWWPKKPKKLNLPESNGDTFNVLHISDIHYSKGYTIGAEGECLEFMCCLADSIKSPERPSVHAPRYGYYRCDTPEILMCGSLNETLNRGVDYEFAIFTGDMIDHNPLFISYKDSIFEEQMVMRSLKTRFNNIPVYAVLGNHDSYPFSQVAQHKSGFAHLHQFNSDLMADLWQDAKWMGSKTAKQVRTHYGGYALTTHRGLRIISLNSNFWYRFNFYNYWDMEVDPDTSGTFRFLVDELIIAEYHSQKVWILAHVPTGGLPNDALPIATRIFTKIVERFSENIAAIFFGHTHQDEFIVMYAGDGSSRTVENALNTAWLGPSITPYVDYNPSWRYYVVDADTFEVVDSITYYMHLDNTFDGSPPEWCMEYSARAAYGDMIACDWPEDAPLNATFWHYVAESIRDDPETTQMYVDYGWRFSPNTPDCTEDDCRFEQYCFTTSMDVPSAIQCRQEYGILRPGFVSSMPKSPMPRPLRKLVGLDHLTGYKF